jgi:hypothetical protein
MAWTERDLAKLKEKGKIRGWKNHFVKSGATEQEAKEEVPDAKGLAEIKRVLAEAGIPFVTELYFAKPRMFRFDVAIESLMVAVEYEGIFNGKSRHTTVMGYTRDATKYNIAAVKGWRVLRYTATNYKQFDQDLQDLRDKVGCLIK